MERAQTVTDAIRILEAEEFATDFSIDDAGVDCAVCHVHCPPAELRILRRFRYEGPTDPGDSAIVLGVECPNCGAKGVIVSAYGPDADDQLLALVERLREE